jgi:hypothetical protein
VERIVENLGEEEYNAIRVCLILKYIRNEDWKQIIEILSIIMITKL